MYKTIQNTNQDIKQTKPSSQLKMIKLPKLKVQIDSKIDYILRLLEYNQARNAQKTVQQQLQNLEIYRKSRCSSTDNCDHLSLTNASVGNQSRVQSTAPLSENQQQKFFYISPNHLIQPQLLYHQFGKSDSSDNEKISINDSQEEFYEADPFEITLREKLNKDFFNRIDLKLCQSKSEPDMETVYYDFQITQRPQQQEQDTQEQLFQIKKIYQNNIISEVKINRDKKQLLLKKTLKTEQTSYEMKQNTPFLEIKKLKQKQPKIQKTPFIPHIICSVRKECHVKKNMNVLSQKSRKIDISQNVKKQTEKNIKQFILKQRKQSQASYKLRNHLIEKVSKISQRPNK